MGTKKEIEAITEAFSGRILLGKEATKKSFNAQAENYGIIHFATHAIIKDDDINASYLALSLDENRSEAESHLYISDLYNSKLSADLVVLSACETGIGELKRGEGINSLAQGFFYAGTKSVITSLWSVSDQATSHLMNEFYQELKKGKRKDVALRNAKLHLITNDNSKYAAPFYWASTISIGDMQALSSNGISWWKIGLILFIVFVFGYWRLQKNRASRLQKG